MDGNRLFEGEPAFQRPRLLRGRLAATREDVIAMAGPVLRHRILLSFAAEAEQKTTDDVVVALLRDVPFTA